jgi:hypothetical protein
MSEETEVPELPLTEDGPTEDVEIEITEEDLEELGDDFSVDTPEEEPEEPQEEQPQDR